MKATSHPLSLDRVPPAVKTTLVGLGLIVFAFVLYLTVPGAGEHFPHGFGGLAVVVALPACLLRRRPLPVLAILLVESLAFETAEHGHSDIALLQFFAADVTLCFIAATRSRRTSILCAVAVLGIIAGGLVIPTLVDHSSLASAAVCALALTVVVAWMVGDSIRQRADHAESLRTQAATQAVVAERLRIARELHDLVAHSIGVIAIQAGAGRRVIDTQPAEARNALAAIEATSRETLVGLRRMLGALRHADSNPSGADPPVSKAPAPGLADVDRLTATTLEAGVHVDVTWRGERRPLAAEIDLSAFRIIQEAVTNVVRHADTLRCQVSVDYRDDEELSIEVVDDGPGGAIEGTGFGIIGMRERVSLLHGQFSAGPRPGGGFRVAARLPR